MGRAAWRSRQGPAGKEGQSPRTIWAEGGAGGGVVPARGVGLPFNSLISNFLQLGRRRRGRCPRAGKLPEKAGSISTLPQGAGPLSSLKSVVSKWAGVPGLPPSPSRAERAPGAHLPAGSHLSRRGPARCGVTRATPPPPRVSARTSTTSPEPKGPPELPGPGSKLPSSHCPGPSALQEPRESGPVVLRSHSDRSQGRKPSFPSETPPHAHLHPGANRPNAPEPVAQVALRPSDRSREGGQDALLEDPSPRRGAASRAGALTCGETWFCPPWAAAAAASSRRRGPRPAPSRNSASPGGPPRSERGHADCWGPGPARALLPRPPASRLRRHLKR